jgi:uncharacterized protein YcbK (DUF882 family)
VSDNNSSDKSASYAPTRRIFLGTLIAGAAASLGGCTALESLFGSASDTQDDGAVPGFLEDITPLARKRAHVNKRPLPLGNEDRRLSFFHIHTGEKLNITYWEQGQYIPEALHDLTYLLRDYRTDTIHHIDNELLDQVFVLRNKLETNTPIHIISGYRSIQTNRILRLHSHGQVAKYSLHTKGRAIDIRLPGRSLNQVRLAALSLQAGGVGYYPDNEFIHMDTGRVRRW